MSSKLKLSRNYFITALFAFIATLGLNVDLSLITSLDNFRIEGYPITRYAEVSGNLSDAMYAIGTFFSGFSGNSVLWLCIFFALCMVFYRAAAVTDPRILRYSAITATAFSILYVVGFSINKYSSLIAITGSVMAFLKSFTAFIGIALVFYGLLAIFFDKVLAHDFDDANIKNNSLIKKMSIINADRKSFLWCCALIFICQLPYLIVYLPGFLSRDTVGQLAQAMGDSVLTDHHPIFMTALSGIFIRFGIMLGSANIGMLLYSLFQMIIVAAAFSYVLQCMAKQNIHVYIRAFTLLFFMLYPVHGFYSITMWKDTLFSIVFMLLTLKTIQMVSQPETYFNSKKNVIVFALLCVALFLTRNNGQYISLILLPALLFFLRKYWKRIGIIIGIFAFSLVAMGIISAALDVQKGSIGESLSIPLQQIVRTAVEHGDELPEREKVLIASILPYEMLPELYEPTISDPVKAQGVFNDAEFRSDIGTYIMLWARLLTMYPATYFEAFLSHTHGYWYPDIDYWIVARELWENDYGVHYLRIVPTFIDNVFSGIFVVRVFPAVSMLISIGFAVWVTIIMALVLMLKRHRNMIIVFLPALLLWLSCIASPVGGMFRYIYGLFLVLPLLISVALQDGRWCGYHGACSAVERICIGGVSAAACCHKAGG